MTPREPHQLLLSLRALGATTTPRFDGHYFSLSGVTGSFVVGERSPDEPDDGDFTICRVPLPAGAPSLVMDLRPQTMREQKDLVRGDAIDVELGDPGFDRAFVVEAAPVSTVRAVLDEDVRAGLVALAPCQLTVGAGQLKLSKAGVWTGDAEVARMVRVCMRVRELLERGPNGLAHGRDAAGYRGEPLAASAAEVAKAAEEIAEVERVRRTRRQVTSANTGLVVLAVFVAAMLFEMWRG